MEPSKEWLENNQLSNQIKITRLSVCKELAEVITSKLKKLSSDYATNTEEFDQLIKLIEAYISLQ